MIEVGDKIDLKKIVAEKNDIPKNDWIITKIIKFLV